MYKGIRRKIYIQYIQDKQRCPAPPNRGRESKANKSSTTLCKLDYFTQAQQVSISRTLSKKVERKKKKKKKRILSFTELLD